MISPDITVQDSFDMRWTDAEGDRDFATTKNSPEGLDFIGRLLTQFRAVCPTSSIVLSAALFRAAFISSEVIAMIFSAELLTTVWTYLCSLFGKLPIIFSTQMTGGVVAPGNQHKILDSIIGFNPVYVVNEFVREKWPAKRLRHDQPTSFYVTPMKSSIRMARSEKITVPILKKLSPLPLRISTSLVKMARQITHVTALFQAASRRLARFKLATATAFALHDALLFRQCSGHGNTSDAVCQEWGGR